MSNARNSGLTASTGSIVAYLDDDAYPDPHWLSYLALTFLESCYGAVGGPNLAPAGDGWIADCISNAPGNPAHVLISDRDAEHIPGCNMAFRKTALETVGGFDPRYCVAGDDVDVCWRLTDAGFTLGFSPAAVVWHHRRSSLRAFWRQQRGYGRAEGMLERWWPGRHDDDGHIAWTGRMYGRGLVRALSWGRSRVYHGVWGAAPFQSIYEPASGGWRTLVQSPLWYLLIAVLGAISVLGLDWAPLRFAFVPLVMAVGALLVQAAKSAAHAVFHPAPLGRWEVLKRRVVIGLLYVIQPAARLIGRLSYAFWNPHWWGEARLHPIWPRTTATWSEHWQDPSTRLCTIEEALRETGVRVRRGGDFDRWDLQVRWGSLGAARLLLGVEDHNLGCQMVRVRVWPRWQIRGPLFMLLFGGLAFGAARANAWIAAVVLGGVATFVALRTVVDAMATLNVMRRALTRSGLARP